MNELPIANVVGFDETQLDFIFDSAHLANEVLLADTELPDSPSLRKALTSPE